jgi:hypothetical protein
VLGCVSHIQGMRLQGSSSGCTRVEITIVTSVVHHGFRGQVNGPSVGVWLPYMTCYV